MVRCISWLHTSREKTHHNQILHHFKLFFIPLFNAVEFIWLSQFRVDLIKQIQKVTACQSKVVVNTLLYSFTKEVISSLICVCLQDYAKNSGSISMSFDGEEESGRRKNSLADLLLNFSSKYYMDLGEGLRSLNALVVSSLFNWFAIIPSFPAKVFTSHLRALFLHLSRWSYSLDAASLWTKRLRDLLHVKQRCCFSLQLQIQIANPCVTLL